MSRATAEQVRIIVLEMYSETLLERGISPGDIGDSFDLLRENVIDSLGILELIQHLEERLGMSIDLTDMDPDQLTELGPLSKYIAGRTDGCAR